MDLFYRKLGEGPPFLILHGLFGSSDNWMTVGKKLACKHKVIIPDLRNHGRSPHSPYLNYYSMCDDILQLLDKLDIDRTIVAGHSMGGKLAMHIAINNPEKTERLIVMDISPKKTEAQQIHFRIIKAMRSVDFEIQKTRKEVEEKISETIDMPKLKMFILKNVFRTERGRLDWRINLDAVEENIDNIMDGINSDKHFSKPALFIKGSKSDYIKDSDVEAISEIFDNYKIKTLENAGHWLHSDNLSGLIRLLIH